MPRNNTESIFIRVSPKFKKDFKDAIQIANALNNTDHTQHTITKELINKWTKKVLNK